MQLIELTSSVMVLRYTLRSKFQPWSHGMTSRYFSRWWFSKAEVNLIPVRLYLTQCESRSLASRTTDMTVDKFLFNSEHCFSVVITNWLQLSFPQWSTLHQWSLVPPMKTCAKVTRDPPNDTRQTNIYSRIWNQPRLPILTKSSSKLFMLICIL